MHLTLALILASSAPQPAECRPALAAAWPDMVAQLDAPIAREITLIGPPGALHVRPSVIATLAQADALLAMCHGDTQAQIMLRSYIADLRVTTEDYAGAFRLLSAQPIDPQSPMAARDAQNLLRAAAGTDATAYRAAVAQVRATHRALAPALGLNPTDSLQRDFGWIDGFRTDLDQGWRLFIAWPDAAMPMVISIPDQPSDSREATWMGCDGTVGSVETASGDAARTPMDDAAALRHAADLFARGPRMPLHPQCTALSDLLIALSQPPKFIGDEFAVSAGTQTAGLAYDQTLDRLVAGSPAQQDRARAMMLAQPQLMLPEQLIAPILQLMQSGDLLQASFLYYFWQLRYRPWAEHGSPSGEQAAFSAMQAIMGERLNAWIGADPALMADVMSRALAFDRRMPLHPSRPNGVREAVWLDTVEKTRERAQRGWLASIPTDDDARRKWAQRRTENGLSNAPLTALGKPLPDDWR